jgi:hypothetical protein
MKKETLGDLTGQMEPILQAMVDKQDMQMGEILNIIRGYLEIHRPECIEQYEDGTRPIFYYGAAEGIK